MDKSNKKMGRKGQMGRPGRYTLAFKRKVAGAYFNGDHSYGQLSVQYGVRRDTLCRWVKQFYGELRITEPIPPDMTEAEQQELEALKKQNEELKKKLEYADMKATALEILIDVAEKQLGIDIKKKPGTKHP